MLSAILQHVIKDSNKDQKRPSELHWQLQMHHRVDSMKMPLQESGEIVRPQGPSLAESSSQQGVDIRSKIRMLEVS